MMRLVFAAVAVLLTANSAFSQAFNPNNLLFTRDNVLTEITRSGTLVRSFNVPHPDTTRYDAADVAIGLDGAAYVRNAAPFSNDYFSRLDPLTGIWTHIAANGIGFGNVSDGDLSIFGNTAVTNGTRLDIGSATVSTFGIPGFAGAGEVSFGFDGLLYVLDSGSPRSDIRVLDPTDFSLVRQLDDVGGFVNDYRGIAVDQSGTIFLADWDGTISSFTSNGDEIATVQTNLGNLLDLDLHRDGTLIVGARFGGIGITDTSLTEVVAIEESDFNSNTYVAFAVTSVPEPSCLSLMLACGLIAPVIRRRSRRLRGL